MRLPEKKFDNRKEKIAEKRNLEQKKQLRDRRYYVIEDDEEPELEIKGNYDEET